MEVLNPIYMVPNMTALTKMTKRQKFSIFLLHCLLKRDGVDRMFPFGFHLENKTLVNGVRDMSRKKLTGGVIRFVGNSHVYQAPKSNCFIAARAIGAHRGLFNVQTNLFWTFLEIKMIGTANPQYSRQSTFMYMFKVIAQYLIFFMLFPGVMIMTSWS